MKEKQLICFPAFTSHIQRTHSKNNKYQKKKILPRNYINSIFFGSWLLLFSSFVLFNFIHTGRTNEWCLWDFQKEKLFQQQTLFIWFVYFIFQISSSTIFLFLFCSFIYFTLGTFFTQIRENGMQKNTFWWLRMVSSSKRKRVQIVYLIFYSCFCCKMNYCIL